MNESLRQRIIAEIAEFTSVPSLESDEFTRSDFVRETGLGRTAASNQLTLLVDRGVLTAREVMDPRSNRRVWAYRKSQ